MLNDWQNVTRDYSAATRDLRDRRAGGDEGVLRHRPRRR